MTTLFGFTLDNHHALLLSHDDDILKLESLGLKVFDLGFVALDLELLPGLEGLVLLGQGDQIFLEGLDLLEVDFLDGEILVLQDVELGVLLAGDVLTLVGIVLGFLLENFLHGRVLGHDRLFVLDVLVGQVDVLLSEARVLLLKLRNPVSALSTQREVLLVGTEQLLLQLLIFLENIFGIELDVLSGVSEQRLGMLELRGQLGNSFPMELLHFLELVFELEVLGTESIELLVGEVDGLEDRAAWAVAP